EIRLWRIPRGSCWRRARTTRKRFWWWNEIRRKARIRGGIGRSSEIEGLMRLGRCWNDGWGRSEVQPEKPAAKSADRPHIYRRRFKFTMSKTTQGKPLR